MLIPFHSPLTPVGTTTSMHKTNEDMLRIIVSDTPITR